MLHAIINGLFVGSVYGLIAIGLTIAFGVMKIINFAIGSLLMLSMFTTFWVTKLLHINLYLALLVVLPFMFFVGYVIQEYLIKSVLVSERDQREPIGVLLLTSGIWMFLDNTVMLIFGPDYRALGNPFDNANWLIADSLLVNKARFVAFLLSAFTAAAIHFFLKFTELGRSIRAVGQDRSMAGLLGINVYKMYNIAFGVSACAVGVAGTALTAFYYVHPNIGLPFGIKSFIIVVLGGLGSIWGAFLAGLIVGLIESVGAQFMAATATEGVIYLFFLLVLFYRPAGMFGLREEW